MTDRDKLREALQELVECKDLQKVLDRADEQSTHSYPDCDCEVCNAKAMLAAARAVLAGTTESAATSQDGEVSTSSPERSGALQDATGGPAADPTTINEAGSVEPECARQCAATGTDTPLKGQTGQRSVRDVASRSDDSTNNGSDRRVKSGEAYGDPVASRDGGESSHDRCGLTDLIGKPALPSLVAGVASGPASPDTEMLVWVNPAPNAAAQIAPSKSRTFNYPPAGIESGPASPQDDALIARLELAGSNLDWNYLAREAADRLREQQAEIERIENRAKALGAGHEQWVRAHQADTDAAWRKVAAATSRAKALHAALEASVESQAHYAELLNAYDGGHRIAFKDADEWLARLNMLAAPEAERESNK